MKLDLKDKLVNLDGKILIDNQNPSGVVMSDLLANLMIQSRETQAIKYYDWALSLHNKGIIELDNADYDILVKFIEKNDSLTVLSKAQLLKRLQEQKELIKKEKNEK